MVLIFSTHLFNLIISIGKILIGPQFTIQVLFIIKSDETEGGLD